MDATVQQDGRQGRASEARAWLFPVLTAFACLLLAVAYRAFLLPEQYYGVEKGLEYWFFRPNQSGALIVMGLAAWLFYRRWPRLVALPARRAPWWGLAGPFALGIGVFLWASYTSAPYLHAVSLAANGAATVLLFRGIAGLRAVWLPLVFVLFAVPIPAPALLAAVWKLQIVTAQYAGWMLYMIGEPAFVSGDQILRATQTFQVIETCSGLRSIETLTMLTFTLIDLFRRRGLHAALLVLLAPAIAFALNGVRVLTLILNPHSELLGVHTLQGVTVLLGGLMVVYWTDGLLEKVLPTPSPGSRLERASHARGRGAIDPHLRTERLVVLLGLAVVTALASVAGPVWEAPAREMPELQRSLDAAMERWPQQDVVKDYLFEGSVKFGDSAHSKVLVSGKPVEIFVGTANLRRGGGSPLSPSTAFPGPGWHVEERRTAALSKELEVSALTLRRGTRQLLVYHWFAGSHGPLGEALRALGALDHSRFRRAEPLYVVRLSTGLEPGSDQLPEEARRLAAYRLSRVFRHLEPVLDSI